MKSQRKNTPIVSSGSMADIAFLLLIFFLLVTTMKFDVGLMQKLPPEKQKDQQPIAIHDRNLFSIQINMHDEILVENESFLDYSALRADLKQFILNNGKLSQYSENPEKAIVSLKVDRGTSYASYIQMLDNIQGVYYGIYADRADMTTKEFRALDLNIESDRNAYLQAKNGIPMNISMAEPTDIYSN